MMIRKCLVFALSAGAAPWDIGALVQAPACSMAATTTETPLGKIMEKVNKEDAALRKGTRNKVAFSKSQKDVEKRAK